MTAWHTVSSSSVTWSSFFGPKTIKKTLHKHCCSFITMKTHTGVNCDPHPLVLLSQNPLEPQMWIHPLLNIVAKKCTISSCLCDKNYSVQLFQEITKPFFFLFFFKWNNIFVSHFKRFRGNLWGWECREVRK